MRHLYALILLFLCLGTAKAQYTFHKGNLPDEESIISYASILNTGAQTLSFDQIVRQKNKLLFKQMSGNFGNLGFTKNNFWVYFQLKNTLSVPLRYYLQTAEPVTDNVDLYLTSQQHQPELQRSGDNLDFSERSLKFRKTTFLIELQPGETKSAYLSIKNDGEKNSLPLILVSEQKLLENTYADQFKMGIFYGILTVISITYFFFYVALKELSFLYYTLYVAFVGLCQFSLDGLYHQYIGTGNSWLSLHAVIISAVFSCFFFARYSEIILNIKKNNKLLYQFFKPLYAVLAVILAGITFVPGFLSYAYPIINVVTLLGMLLIFFCIATNFYQRQAVDIYYTLGIVILFLTIILAILMNFGVFPEDLSMEDITKPGIALEIIALSLSMSNRMRLMKNQEQHLQALALQRAEEMNNIKSYFLANMSHELRTPLNAIVGLADLMESHSNDPEIQANCEIIKYTSHGLISSVTDILDFSSIEKGELKLENAGFNPVLLVNKIAKSTELQCKDKLIGFRFHSSLSAGVQFVGDAARLEQIIHNIISNALKFTNTGSVTFDVKAEYASDHALLAIIITDTGIGIPSHKTNSIFELFSQTDFDNTRKYGGFGIGLSIVKALISLHGGKISLNSEPGRGTACTVVLSYPTYVPKQTLNDKYPANFHSANILIVEDNPINQMIIKMMLKDWQQAQIHVAGNGAECLQLLQHTKVDLILMDLQMPVMDGYEATALIRKGAAGISHITVPIIAVTADSTSSSKERILQCGASDYMNKPIDKIVLYDKMNKLILGQSNHNHSHSPKY